jgi:bifunctional non-homologous end joining protein LigD
MGLDEYRRRRDFDRTPEPEPVEAPGRGGPLPRFVVQKHGARRLHYDLRLEHDGVLWSWAVTRGPSLSPAEKRLAVRTEDHPLGYADFEGLIPPGQYGAGPVLLWDRGHWHPVGDPQAGERKGHLEFVLDGERLKGRWHLVRMARRAREKAETWLLIKARDEAARPPDAPDILDEAQTSVASGRRLEEIAEGAAPRRRRSARIRAGGGAAGHPGFVKPALATLRDAAPAGSRWLHEIKFDGYRLQAHLAGAAVRLLTRSGHDWTERFGPRLAGALAGLDAHAIIDGEAVVEDANGVSDFGALQEALAESRTDRIAFYAFDLLWCEGRDLRPLPLVERKAELERLLAGAPEPVRFSESFEEEGEVLLRHACRLSLEGVVSKRRDDPYRSGRTTSWIKSKCLNRQEFVILGYMPSAADGRAVGALLLGQNGPGGLEVAGRVGTGFTRRAARDLVDRLEPIRRAEPATCTPLDARTRREIRFVEPVLVAEVEFLSRTRDGTLRHASFRGLREDKPAAEVVAEERAAAAGAGAAAAADPAPRPPDFPRLTHADRVYWPEAGITKEALADHYLAVWRLMAPHLVRRPLALLRCPRGHEAPCFFQKHAWRGMSRQILRLVDPLDEGDDPSMIAIETLSGLGALVQSGALEIHTWQASADDLERPDQIVMDLDPGEGVTAEALVAAVFEVRDRLGEAGLRSFLKTTGGKGFHIIAPLEPGAGWESVKDFARAIAEAMAADSPDRYVATISKAKRRGRILVDYLRNGRGATAVAPYSSRARAGAPVSMPLAWEELDTTLAPDRFTIANTPARLASLGADPWADFRRAAAPLPGADRETGGARRADHATGGARRAKAGRRGVARRS